MYSHKLNMHMYDSQLLDTDDEMEVMSEQWRERLTCVMQSLGEQTNMRGENGEPTEFAKAINGILVTLQHEEALSAREAAARASSLAVPDRKDGTARATTPGPTVTPPVSGGGKNDPKRVLSPPVVLFGDDEPVPSGASPPEESSETAPALKGPDSRGSQPEDGANTSSLEKAAQQADEEAVIRRLRRRMIADFRLAKGVLEALLASDADAFKQTQMRGEFEQALRGMMDQDKFKSESPIKKDDNRSVVVI
jgi:hypothetical protein